MSGVMPGAANTDRDIERNVERYGVAHLAAYQLCQRLPLPGPNLENELVVHLKQHATTHSGIIKRLFDIKHCDFDDVRC